MSTIIHHRSPRILAMCLPASAMPAGGSGMTSKSWYLVVRGRCGLQFETRATNSMGAEVGYAMAYTEVVRGCGEIGRRAGFRFQFPQGSVGSSPIIRTNNKLLELIALG